MNELKESFKEMYDNLILEAVLKGLMNTEKRFVFITHSLEKEDSKYEKNNKLFRFNYKFNLNYSFKNESFNSDPMTSVIDLLPIREKMKELSITYFSDIDELKRFIYSEIVKENKL